ncbi:hypothetical protein [Corynebacterium ulcerans]|uniref:hypothetical protein n=1 Tax=Corynebacterium ulcerans TaxID=65058 RepID=UPI0002141BD6|nr:hypothetical protein [Corynebacterium ulcerans]AEG84416.1 hypothetical protein CULC22_01706 [Corynebacterium ulcerans BR-AD22]
MPKYVRNSEVVEAVQFTKNISSLELLSTFLVGQCASLVGHKEHGMCLEIETLKGTVQATPGDWIVKGVQGEFYPVQADIFAQTYEEVEP